jgi:maleate cis-trans isomerase
MSAHFTVVPQKIEIMNTIGFISAPAWFDPAPSEFPAVVEEKVFTQQTPLLLPDFDYQLSSIASVQEELNLCSRSLKSMGCNIIAQVGSPFSWAGIKSEQGARSRLKSMQESSGAPVIMTGLAIVDRLRILNISKVAVNCSYYDSEWRDSFSSFLEVCGFQVDHCSTLCDQGLAPENSKIEDFGWSMTDELTRESVDIVSNSAPNAEAIVITGAGTRTLNILNELETSTNRPIIAADTVIYWAIANALGLTLKPILGSLANRI